MAKLVSDPWFCAAVTSQAGLRARFIHQFSAGLAVPASVLASCAAQRAGRPGQGVPGWAGGVSKSAEGLTLLRRRIFFYLSWGLDRSSQPL